MGANLLHGWNSSCIVLIPEATTYYPDQTTAEVTEAPSYTPTGIYVTFPDDLSSSYLEKACVEKTTASKTKTYLTL